MTRAQYPESTNTQKIRNNKISVPQQNTHVTLHIYNSNVRRVKTDWSLGSLVSQANLHGEFQVNGRCCLKINKQKKKGCMAPKEPHLSPLYTCINVHTQIHIITCVWLSDNNGDINSHMNVALVPFFWKIIDWFFCVCERERERESKGGGGHSFVAWEERKGNLTPTLSA